VHEHEQQNPASPSGLNISEAYLRVVGYAEKAVTNPFVAYAAIAALQLRVIWNIWKYSDLASGDTSYYFVDVATWQHGLHENIVYSPLYDAFWGTILAVVHNLYAAAIIQRVAIVLAVALLVLALMRSLFGPALGLLMAAWWVIIPANYDVLYEVHLMGALPILLALLVVALMPRRQGMGIAVAILLAGAVLLRTELVAAAATLAVAVAVYEVWELRGGRRASRSAYLRAYVVPIALALLVIGGTYARSYVQGNEAWQLLQAKEERGFCNFYTSAYQQRHPTRFTGSYWTECQPLMQQTFGRPEPSILQATAVNPRAVAAFLAWNAQLLPGGLQVSLLGASSFASDPSPLPVTESSTYALLLSVVMSLLLIAGLISVVRDRKASPRRVSARTMWIAVTLASIAVATVLVALTTRPWSEYIYGLTLGALIVTGAAILTLMRRIGGAHILAPVALLTVAALIVALPSMYDPGRRPIYEGVQHLEIAQKQLQQPGSVLVASENENELCNYLAYSYQRKCTATSWLALRSQVTPQRSAGQVLDRAHATAIYVDASMLSEPAIAGFVADPRARGWRQIARGSGPSGPWYVLLPVSQRSRS
jgi:hypothetical protein